MDLDTDSIQVFQNTKYELVVDVEMQRVLEESSTERFIKYMSYIDAGILNEKIIILVLIIKNSSKKSLPKYKTITEYNNHKIIEVDLNYCYSLIDKKKEIWLVDSNKILTKKGMEWIKLLSMQLWCKAFQNEVYCLPNLESLHFYQPEVKKALQILNVNYPLYSFLIDKENEAMNNNAKILELEKTNHDNKKSLKEKDKALKAKDKSIQEKDNKINKLSAKIMEYKNILKSNGLLKSGKDEDKSSDDLDYYQGAKEDNPDEDDDDEDYSPKEDELDEDDM